MNRRHLLKNVLAGSASLLALPSWANLWNSTSISADLFSSSEKKTMAALVETIIPDAADVPGAKALGVHVFLEKLLKDCYETEIQKNVSVNLAALEKNARSGFGRSFEACNADQRKELFGKLERSAEKSEADFFKLIKSETIRGYTTSEYVMVNHLGYKVAPGHFYGCVSVNT